MSYILYKIENREIVPTEDINLKEDMIYLIIDKTGKKSKIWIWSGPNSNNMDRYFAGVSATKIKSKKRLYGATIEVVDGGNEPSYFPVLTKDALKGDVTDKIDIEKVIVPEIEDKEEKEIEPVMTTDSVDAVEIEATTEVVSRLEDLKIAEEQVLELKNKFKDFLSDLTMDLAVFQKKIKVFLEDLK